MKTVVVLICVLATCGVAQPVPATAAASAQVTTTNASPFWDCPPCRMALLPYTGRGRLDREIVQLQAKVKTDPDPIRVLDRLGWMFVAKARAENDEGLYRLAEQCALCMEQREPGCPEALLLRGHVLHNFHRFKEAQEVAQTLVHQRGAPFDYGLLGDTLLDQGQLNEAVAAYQKMVDLRPDLHSYSRVAQIRWLKGDLEGALEMMRLAARSGSGRDFESGAWSQVRLAFYELQAGHLNQAREAVETAMKLQPKYAAAFLIQGRIQLAEGQTTQAIHSLRQACDLNPMPEYQWALAEALQTSGQEKEAKKVEKALQRLGTRQDPRTYSLYLSTRRMKPEAALRLAEEELRKRTDIFTHDTLAWALFASGKVSEARAHMTQALAEGTIDARLFFHAAAIGTAAGDKAMTDQYLPRAVALKHLLLPSEKESLSHLQGRLGAVGKETGGSPTNPKETNTP